MLEQFEHDVTWIELELDPSSGQHLATNPIDLRYAETYLSSLARRSSASNGFVK